MGARPAGRVEGTPADEHAPSRGGSRPAARPVDPAERIQLGEEVDERRDDRLFPSGLGAEQGHLRHQVAVIALGRGDQRAERAGRPGDVGVGEQDIRGAGRTGRRQSLRHGPGLARPPGGRGGAVNDAQRPGRPGADGSRDLTRAVGTAVVDERHRERAWIVLGQQAGQRDRQDGRLVPGRHHGDDPGPGGRPRRARASGPEAADRSARSHRGRPAGPPMRRRPAPPRYQEQAQGKPGAAHGSPAHGEPGTAASPAHAQPGHRPRATGARRGSCRSGR